MAFVLLQHLKIDQPVVHGDPVPHVDRLKQVRIVDVDGAFLDVHRTACGDGDNVALPQVELVGKIAGADLRTLRVQENGNRKFHLPVERLDVLDDLGVRLVVAVGHVETGDTHPGLVELVQHFVGFCGGTDRADDASLLHVAPLG